MAIEGEHLGRKCTVEEVPREVIQNQLLTRLESDKSVVAIMVDEDDLALLIQALDKLGTTKSKEFAKDGRQLMKAAFQREC